MIIIPVKLIQLLQQSKKRKRKSFLKIENDYAKNITFYETT